MVLDKVDEAALEKILNTWSQEQSDAETDAISIDSKA